MKHFKHCYAYDGSYCSCGASETGGYQGDQAGPDLQLPPVPFNLIAPTRPVEESPAHVWTGVIRDGHAYITDQPNCDDECLGIHNSPEGPVDCDGRPI